MTVLHNTFGAPARTRVGYRPATPARMTREEALARLAQRTMPLPGRPGHAASGSTCTTPGAPTSSGHQSRAMHASMPTQPPAVAYPKPKLSQREIEVLRAWLNLDSKSAVAESLFISLGTVNTHLARIRVKYNEVGRGAPTKAALVARAIQDGIVHIDDL
ncbi:MAG: LuxR family transcriptional regulator [Gordonia sp.]|nr:LuxR family transcriptional regulator [Gordonia sp. (in: high G+C Gram-positive bacteria)]